MAELIVQTSVSPRLPLQPNELIGRQQTLEMVQTALARLDCRLLTLLGSGGIGKTRLALAVAEAAEDQFADGVCFVDLTQISDAASVPSLLTNRLGLRAEDRSPLERVKGYLQDRQLLLMLDNCEHVLPVALLVAELLQDCLDLTILATSREPLRLRWEHRMVVSPLDLPDLHRLPPTNELQGIAAVALFLQRARAIDLRFAVDDEMLQQIAAVCVRLEGVPLAIELAARRTNVLSPAAMLHRLAESTAVLQQRAPDVPARQESIQATLDWSYQLLTEPEQVGFRRLGVFIARFSLEAAEAAIASVAADSPSTLDVLSSLADKGLVIVESNPEEEPGYRLLETVRAYALEQLQQAGETADVQAAHATHYLSIAERENGDLRSGGYLVFSPSDAAQDTPHRRHVAWPLQLDQDHANLRQALIWAQEYDDTILLRLASALARYWWVRGYLQEGTHWLEMAIARNVDAEPALRMRALNGLGILQRQRGDFGRATMNLEETLVLARALDDAKIRVAQLLDLAGARYCLEQTSEAIALYREAVALSRSTGDTWGTAAALTLLGITELRPGHGNAAQELFMQALPLFRDLGDLRGIIVVDVGLAHVLAVQGVMQRALALLDEAGRLCEELDQETLTVLTIEGVAEVAAREGALEACARLLGACEVMRLRGHARTIEERIAYDEAMGTVAEKLDEERLAAALTQGRCLSAEQALGEAMAFVQTMMSTHTEATTEPMRADRGTLSTRELEVFKLLAEGCTNKEIGRRLGFTENTAKFHVTSILTKLGVNSRTEAVSVAVKRGLV